MKKFLILGNMNAITYKEVFSRFKNNELFIGYEFNKSVEFILPQDSKTYKREENGVKYASVSIRWFTNLKVNIIKQLDLTKNYNSKDYFVYDNYNAIEVSKVKDIPKDYYGYMGVPINFIDKYNPNQFEIIDKLSPFINKKALYKRIIIKRK